MNKLHQNILQLYTKFLDKPFVDKVPFFVEPKVVPAIAISNTHLINNGKG
jgi:hypothetical protein